MPTIILSGCSSIGGFVGGAVVDTLTGGGGGPNVAANGQIAKTATQTIGKTEVQDLRAETINQTTTNIQETDYLLIGALGLALIILGSLIDDVIKEGLHKWRKR